jgi:hypothetical protein
MKFSEDFFRTLNAKARYILLFLFTFLCFYFCALRAILVYAPRNRVPDVIILFACVVCSVTILANLYYGPPPKRKGSRKRQT